AALLERERFLIEKTRFMKEASNRHRLNAELELGDIRRRLERLAFQGQPSGARPPDRARPEVRKDPIPRGAPLPRVTQVPAPEAKKKHQAPSRSQLVRLYDRLVAMCVVETTAATQNGIRS